MKHSHHSILVLFLCSTCTLPGMEIVSSTTALADIAKEKVQIWMQSKSAYATFYSAVRTALHENLKKEAPDSSATIAEAAAQKASLNWPLDSVHREGLADYGSPWTSELASSAVPLTSAPISTEYLLVRGRYAVRSALDKEKEGYCTQEKNGKNSSLEHAAFATVVGSVPK